MKFNHRIFSLLFIFSLCCYGQTKEPTHSNIRYSKKYERSVLDLWLAESNKPTPW